MPNIANYRTNMNLESRLKEAEFRLKEAKSVVSNLKENIQSLKYDNNFLLDILQSNGSIWSKPKRTCLSKSVPDRTELFILNSFGALEDETHVVERATCSEASASCCFVNRDESVVIEDETTNAAVDEVMRSEVTRSANVSPSGEILVKNQSTNPENPAQDHVLEANSKSIKDGGCLKSNAYADQVADYRNSQKRRFNTSKKTLLVGDSMTKHICNQKVDRACRGLSINVTHIARLP